MSRPVPCPVPPSSCARAARGHAIVPRSVPSPALSERCHRGLPRAPSPRAARGIAQHVRQGLSRPTWHERRAPALWRRGEVQLDRLAAGTRARLGGELSGAGLKDLRRDLLRAVDADPGAEHPAAPCSCNSTCEMSVRGSRSSHLHAGSGAARGQSQGPLQRAQCCRSLAV
jgi:hypothetical protein